MGGDGKSAQNVVAKNPEALDQMTAKGKMNPKLQDIMAQYSQGKMSLQDAMSQAQAGSKMQKTAQTPEARDAYVNSHLQDKLQGDLASESKLGHIHSQGDVDRITQEAKTALGDQYGQETQAGDDKYNADNNLTPDAYKNFTDSLASDPTTGSKYAQDQLKDNDVYKQGLDQYQKAGANADKLNTQMDTDRDSMSGKDDAYKLQDSDYAAYGQGMGNITRDFGAQESSLADSLASRGLGAGGSGAAGASFSGLQGNKNEQLAQLQRQISQDRITKAADMIKARSQLDTQQAQQNNQLMENLGQQGSQALNDQYNRNMTGVGRDDKNNQVLTADQMQHQEDQQNQSNEEFKQEQATKGPGLAGALGAVGGALAGGLTGGLGTGIGTSLGGSLGKALGGTSPAAK